MSSGSGRVSPGQRLTTAFSARAWNRAQDAADIVLGDRLSVTASPAMPSQHQLIVKCSVVAGNFPTSGQPFSMRPGMIVDLRSTSGTTAIRGSVGFDGMSAVPFPAVPLVDRRQQAAKKFGVIVGGATMPRGSSTAVVDVCVAGVCVMELKRRSTPGLLTSVQPAVIRSSSDTDDALLGIAEDSECGSGRLLRWLSQIPDTPNQYALVLL